MIALNHAAPLSRRPKLPLLGGLGLGGRVRHSAGLNGIVVGITASGAPSGLGRLSFLSCELISIKQSCTLRLRIRTPFRPSLSVGGERAVEGRGPDKLLFTRHERKWHGIGGWLREDRGNH